MELTVFYPNGATALNDYYMGIQNAAFIQTTNVGAEYIGTALEAFEYSTTVRLWTVTSTGTQTQVGAVGLYVPWDTASGSVDISVASDTAIPSNGSFWISFDGDTAASRRFIAYPNQNGKTISAGNVTVNWTAIFDYDYGDVSLYFSSVSITLATGAAGYTGQNAAETDRAVAGAGSFTYAGGVAAESDAGVQGIYPMTYGGATAAETDIAIAGEAKMPAAVSWTETNGTYKLHLNYGSTKLSDITFNVRDEEFNELALDTFTAMYSDSTGTYFTVDDPHGKDAVIRVGLLPARHAATGNYFATSLQVWIDCGTSMAGSLGVYAYFNRATGRSGDLYQGIPPLYQSAYATPVARITDMSSFQIIFALDCPLKLDVFPSANVAAGTDYLITMGGQKTSSGRTTAVAIVFTEHVPSSSSVVRTSNACREGWFYTDQYGFLGGFDCFSERRALNNGEKGAWYYASACSYRGDNNCKIVANHDAYWNEMWTDANDVAFGLGGQVLEDFIYTCANNTGSATVRGMNLPYNYKATTDGPYIEKVTTLESEWTQPTMEQVEEAARPWKNFLWDYAATRLQGAATYGMGTSWIGRTNNFRGTGTVTQGSCSAWNAVLNFTGASNIEIGDTYYNNNFTGGVIDVNSKKHIVVAWNGVEMEYSVTFSTTGFSGAGEGVKLLVREWTGSWAQNTDPTAYPSSTVYESALLKPSTSGEYSITFTPSSNAKFLECLLQVTGTGTMAVQYIELSPTDTSIWGLGVNSTYENPDGTTQFCTRIIPPIGIYNYVATVRDEFPEFFAENSTRLNEIMQGCHDSVITYGLGGTGNRYIKWGMGVGEHYMWNVASSIYYVTLYAMYAKTGTKFFTDAEFLEIFDAQPMRPVGYQGASWDRPFISAATFHGLAEPWWGNGTVPLGSWWGLAGTLATSDYANNGSSMRCDSYFYKLAIAHNVPDILTYYDKYMSWLFGEYPTYAVWDTELESYFDVYRRWGPKELDSFGTILGMNVGSQLAAVPALSIIETATKNVYDIRWTFYYGEDFSKYVLRRSTSPDITYDGANNGTLVGEFTDPYDQYYSLDLRGVNISPLYFRLFVERIDQTPLRSNEVVVVTPLIYAIPEGVSVDETYSSTSSMVGISIDSVSIFDTLPSSWFSPDWIDPSLVESDSNNIAVVQYARVDNRQLRINEVAERLASFASLINESIVISDLNDVTVGMVRSHDSSLPITEENIYLFQLLAVIAESIDIDETMAQLVSAIIVRAISETLIGNDLVRFTRAIIPIVAERVDINDSRVILNRKVFSILETLNANEGAQRVDVFARSVGEQLGVNELSNYTGLYVPSADYKYSASELVAVAELVVQALRSPDTWTTESVGKHQWSTDDAEPDTFRHDKPNDATWLRR